MTGKAQREPAWTYLMANVLILPGLGSFMGGRRVAGTLQALAASAGFALTMLWLWSYGTALLGSGLPEGLGPRGGEGLLGIALFAVSWVWSLASGLSLLRESRQTPTNR